MDMPRPDYDVPTPAEYEPSDNLPLVNEIIIDGEVIDDRERLDNPQDNYELERRAIALDYIREGYSLPGLNERQKALAPILSPVHAVENIGNQFGNKLLNVYMSDLDVDEAYERYRAIQANTVDEEMALLLSKKQFEELFNGLRIHLAESDDAIVETVAARLHLKTGQIGKNDRYEFNGNETVRSLNELLRRGVTIQMDGERAVEEVKNAAVEAERMGLPITELLKNKKVLIANGFPDSKVSVAIHDIMDHAWGFWLMRQTGLDVKFRDLFESIGNPAATDIYKREGEIPASICFGVRYWATQERGFTPIINATNIRCMMESYFDQDELEEHHMQAFRILRTMTEDSHEWQSLSFTYSNYVTELDEQRRKHGKIKQRDPVTREVIGELPTDSPDFLAFFVELHHQLMQSENKHRDQLFRTHLLFEEYLKGVANGALTGQNVFAVKIDQLEDYRYQNSTLEPRVIRWMFRNYGFTATKDTLV